MSLHLTGLVIIGSFASGTTAFAQSKPLPEVLSFKFKPSLERCVGDTKTRSMTCSKQADGSKVEQVRITLSECDSSSTDSKNCAGSWEKELSIDGGKFVYKVRVNSSDKANFKYLVSLQICRSELTGDICTRQSTFLKDKNFPYLVSLKGPVATRSDFRGGQGYDSVVLYESSLAFGDGAGEWIAQRFDYNTLESKS